MTPLSTSLQLAIIFHYTYTYFLLYADGQSRRISELRFGTPTLIRSEDYILPLPNFLLLARYDPNVAKKST